ncbi:hypothetical protein DFH28DRAFT_883577 [Melampsora americana]|nr:hypothetical protein DFH28DRAFT_883577 [Melampsora americana]
MAPIKIKTPQISSKAMKFVELARAKGEDLTQVDIMMEILDYQNMQYFASLTCRLKRDGSNFDDWLYSLEQNIWSMAQKPFYLSEPRQDVTLLYDWVVDEVLLAMSRATVHRSCTEAISLATDPHDAVMWIKFFYDIEGM